MLGYLQGTIKLVILCVASEWEWKGLTLDT